MLLARACVKRSLIEKFILFFFFNVNNVLYIMCGGDDFMNMGLEKEVNCPW